MSNTVKRGSAVYSVKQMIHANPTGPYCSHFMKVGGLLLKD